MQIQVYHFFPDTGVIFQQPTGRRTRSSKYIFLSALNNGMGVVSGATLAATFQVRTWNHWNKWHRYLHATILRRIYCMIFMAICTHTHIYIMYSCLYPYLISNNWLSDIYCDSCLTSNNYRIPNNYLISNNYLI